MKYLIISIVALILSIASLSFACIRVLERQYTGYTSISIERVCINGWEYVVTKNSSGSAVSTVQSFKRVYINDLKDVVSVPIACECNK